MERALRVAADRLARAVDAEAAAREALLAAMRRASASGMSLADIGRATGLTRQRVHQLLR